MSNAPRSLLEIVNAAQEELGLPISASVIGNSDPTTVQMLAVLQKIGEELRDWAEDGWKNMQVEFNLVVTVPILTTGTLTANSAIITSIAGGTGGLSPTSWVVQGESIPAAARIISVDSSSQVTMNMEATTGAVQTSLNFAQDTYTLPPDFKAPINRTWWDRTNRWELLGPDSPQMDQWHRSGIVVTGPRRHFRYIGRPLTQYRLWPPPFETVSPLQLAFEYFSTDWILENGTGTIFTSSWQADTDTPVLDDRALIDGLKWMFWKRKGLAFESDRNDWVDFVDRLWARDTAAPTVQLAKRQNPIFISPANVQDGFFPGPVGPNTGS